jgi:putative FmdB family regulatory protein
MNRAKRERGKGVRVPELWPQPSLPSFLLSALPPITAGKLQNVPVYEYEPDDRDCLMCEGRVDVIQGINEEPLKYCPWCGLEVRRVISRVTFKLAGTPAQDAASKKGFTTFRRAEKGIWEKVAGEGPDFMAGSKEDVAAVEAEKVAAKKVVDLDKEVS